MLYSLCRVVVVGYLKPGTEPTAKKVTFSWFLLPFSDGQNRTFDVKTLKISTSQHEILMKPFEFCLRKRLLGIKD